MTRVLGNAGRGPVALEHPELAASAQRGIEALEQLRRHVGPAPGQALWMQHLDYLDRATQLAGHLSAAVQLADVGRMASAFVLLRTALEHQVIDRLVLLADRYQQLVDDLAEDEFQRMHDEWRAGADWARGVASFVRTKKGAVLVRLGHDVVDGDGNVVEQISPYWPVLDEHQPTLGPPEVQRFFHNGIGDPSDQERWANSNRSLYHRYLTWQALLDNLELNDLVPAHERIRYEVHYRFLSAFTHATRFGYETIGQRTSFSPSVHHVSELVLLYATAICEAEVLSFVEFVNRRLGLLVLREARALGEVLRGLHVSCAHLWFAGHEPTPFDHFEEANRRVWRSWDGRSAIPSDRTPPDKIPAIDVAYYSDPLHRLHQLHTGGAELTTGFSHRPMW